MAARIGPWYAAVAVLVAGLASSILKLQATIARDASERVMLDVVRNGTVTVPLLEQLDQDLDALISRLPA